MKKEKGKCATNEFEIKAFPDKYRKIVYFTFSDGFFESKRGFSFRLQSSKSVFLF
jgi:hypothetical protein